VPPRLCGGIGNTAVTSPKQAGPPHRTRCWLVNDWLLQGFPCLVLLSPRLQATYRLARQQAAGFSELASWDTGRH